MKKLLSLVCLPVAMSLVTGCGFHLQTKAELPPQMNTTRLEIQSPYSEFARRLETHLEQNGAKIVTSAKGAAVLEVPLNSARREIQSVGVNARVQEFLIRHQVQFRLLDSNGAELVPLQSLELSRVYSFNKQDVLAAEREDEFLRSDLADNLARMVVRRLGTYGK